MTAPLRSIGCAALLAIGLGMVGAPAHAEESGAPFTARERAALRSGELVRRPVARRERGGRYLGGTSWQRVRAPREAVWAMINDVRNYSRIIPGVDVAQVVETQGARRTVFLRHRYAFVSASYYAHVEADPETYTLTFRLDPSRPRDIEDGRGFVTLDRYGEDETIVTWGVMANVGSGLLTGMLAPVLHDWILRVPWCIQTRMEPSEESC